MAVAWPAVMPSYVTSAPSTEAFSGAAIATVAIRNAETRKTCPLKRTLRETGLMLSFDAGLRLEFPPGAATMDPCVNPTRRLRWCEIEDGWYAMPLDIPKERIPRHIAIIMDGNGRWAVRRGSSACAGTSKAQRPSAPSSPNAPAAQERRRARFPHALLLQPRELEAAGERSRRSSCRCTSSTCGRSGRR